MHYYPAETAPARSFALSAHTSYLASPVMSFSGEYRWLSSFWPCNVLYDGTLYASAEHAFQAAKTHDPAARAVIARMSSAREAKRAGRAIPLRPDWERARRSVMLSVVLAKFCGNPDLQALLLTTGDRPLVEGNDWGDDFWGAVRVTPGSPAVPGVPVPGRDLPLWAADGQPGTWAGHNWLGWCLMMVRDVLS